VLVSARLKWVRENLCRPSGTRSDFPLYPGLTSWANIFRPSGAGILQILFHSSPPQSSSHAHTEALLHPETRPCSKRVHLTTKVKSKGGGQECPPHINRISGFAVVEGVYALGPLGHHALHGRLGGGWGDGGVGRSFSRFFARRDSRSFPFGWLRVRMTIVYGTTIVLGIGGTLIRRRSRSFPFGWLRVRMTIIYGTTIVLRIGSGSAGFLD
jgi:hypothetical protein